MPDSITLSPTAGDPADYTADPALGMCAAAGFRRSLETSRQQEWPYRHWLLTDVLPAPVADAVAGLPLDPPPVGDTAGRRETHNATRIFLNPDLQVRYPVAAELAAAFQHRETVALLQSRCGVRLAGSYLRIEYCLDRQGFWLEPHTDIGAKRFTMLVYLSRDPGAEGWGTDVYADPKAPPVARADAAFNRGLIFVPGTDTWHGFEPRPIDGIRRTLIVNYVIPDWRSRHELAFPDALV